MNVADEKLTMKLGVRGPELAGRQLQDKSVLQARHVCLAGDDGHHLITQTVR